MRFLMRLGLTAVSAYLLQMVLSGVHFDRFSTAIGFALVLAFLNVVVKPLLKIVGFPITVFTLGFFLLVINALIVLIADYFVIGMQVDGFWWAFFFSILLSLITSALESLLLGEK
ncbi:phage holin family protein [Bergeyella sp. RCAD1439]|uniref:phage holin family protein n=1 Tax=Bergeyella anatis TaxID=3113737 RepID=UPI002E176793|nr:phage holin family protein [Bergeyella sp. RCAD1439]